MQAGKGGMPIQLFILTLIPKILPAMKPSCSPQVMKSESGQYHIEHGVLLDILWYSLLLSMGCGWVPPGVDPPPPNGFGPRAVPLAKKWVGALLI